MASKERNQGRVDRIVAARAKLLERVKVRPKDVAAGQWKAKIVEYEESLRNFYEFGQEKKPTGNAEAVNIGVPLADLKIKSQAPGD